MDTTLYIIRHASTAFNSSEKYQGRIDNPLDENGIKECEALAQRMIHINLDKVFTGPLQRAVSTAEVLCVGKGLVPIQIDALTEFDLGDMEGCSYSEYPSVGGIPGESFFAFCAPGGESMKQVYERAVSAFNTILSNCKGMTVAVVTHRCVIQTICRHLKKDLGCTIAETRLIPTCVIKVTITSDGQVRTNIF